MASNYRYKLLKTFWYTAKQAGVSEENARAFAQAIYPGKRLSRMTVDELERVTRDFIAVHRVGVSMPRKKSKREKSPSRNSRVELATPEQIDLIDNYADALGLQDFHLESLMYRAGSRYGEPMTLKVAQNMIEAMKKMLSRGWKPKVTKEIKYDNVTWQ